MNIEENIASRQPKWKFRLSTKFSVKFCEMIEKSALFLLLCFTVILVSSVLSDNVKKKSLHHEIAKGPHVSPLKATRKSDSPVTLSPVTAATIISGKFSRNDTISTTNSTETSTSDSDGEDESAALENETKTVANQTTFPLLVTKVGPPVAVSATTAKKVPATTSLVKETRSSGSYTDLRDFMGKPMLCFSHTHNGSSLFWPSNLLNTFFFHMLVNNSMQIKTLSKP